MDFDRRLDKSRCFLDKINNIFMVIDGKKNLSCTRAVVFYILLQGYFSSIDYLLKFKFRLSLTLDVQSMMY